MRFGYEVLVAVAGLLVLLCSPIPTLAQQQWYFTVQGHRSISFPSLSACEDGRSEYANSAGPGAHMVYPASPCRPLAVYNPIPALKNRLAKLDSQESRLQSQASSLQQSNSQLQSQADDLNRKLAALGDDINRLQTSNAESEKRLLDLKKAEALNNLKGLAGSSREGLDSFDTAPGNPLDLKSLAGTGTPDSDVDSLGLKPLIQPQAEARLPGKTSAHASSVGKKTVEKKRVAVARKPRSPGTAWAYKGWEALQAHDWKMAAAWYKEALARDPRNEALVGMVRYADWAASHAPNPISRENGGAGVYKLETPGPDPEMLRLMDGWAKANPELIPPGRLPVIPATTEKAAQSQ